MYPITLRRHKYLVISWDESEQQPFWDVVMSTSKKRAMYKVGRLRGDYADICDAVSVDELAGLVRRYESYTPREIEREWRMLRAERNRERTG